jgi:serine/threonine-protein kinase
VVNPSELLDARYRLERLLGTGGMSEVWLAEDTRLSRWVAVKILRDLSREPELAGALEKEARVVAQLQHPGIVTVFDAGRHGQQNYLVMEYVHGYSLRQLLTTQGRLTEQEALRYGEQIAEALHYAHTKGIVHCDVKPENILVTQEGVAKVADFGVAETISRTMTPQQARELAGTVAYLAPEVIQGAPPSPAADIYALGLLIYELVAGRLPYAGTTAASSAAQRLAGQAPSLRAFAMGASVELDAVLARALALNPADRFPSAHIFAGAMRRVPIRPGSGVPAVVSAPGTLPPLRQRSRSTTRLSSAPRSNPAGGWFWAALAVALAGAIVVGAGGAYFLANRDGTNTARTPTPSPPSATARASTSTPRPPTQTPTNEATFTPTVTKTPPAATPTPSPTRPPLPSVSPSVPPTVASSPSPRPGQP